MRREGGFRFFKGMFCVVHRGDRHNAVRRRSAFLYKNGVEGDPRKKKKKKKTAKTKDDRLEIQPKRGERERKVVRLTRLFDVKTL